MTRVKIISFEIKKRTFEGKTDPLKNDEPLTSKYMTGNCYVALYIARYCYDDGSEVELARDRCYRTKKEAEQDMAKGVEGYII